MTSSSSSSSSPVLPSFEPTPLPLLPHNPSFIKTAACLIIGDEVLNGKTRDSNSHYFAKFCFNLGIDLKRIEVISDEPEMIIEAARRLSNQYGFVVSSGGIGPTPDDVTYPSMAKAFHAEPLQYHDETIRRMSESLRLRKLDDSKVTEEMITARKRMALFPSSNIEIIYPCENLWVPIVRMQKTLCILPGVPRLFEALLDGLEKYLCIDPNQPKPFRFLIHTKLPESNISPFLIDLTNQCKLLDIKVGSYPKWNNGVDVSLIGTDFVKLQQLVDKVEKGVDGKLISCGKIGQESQNTTMMEDDVQKGKM